VAQVRMARHANRLLLECLRDARELRSQRSGTADIAREPGEEPDHCPPVPAGGRDLQANALGAMSQDALAYVLAASLGVRSPTQ
jgi:hypothetical protein